MYDETIFLNFEAFAEISCRSAYGSSKDYNGLFKIDLLTGECKYVGMFPEEKADGKRLYTAAILVENKIFFAPARANNICIYDYKDNLFKLLKLNEACGKYYIETEKFNDIFVYNKWVYMIPCTYPYLIRIDIETYNIEYIDIDLEEEYVFRRGKYVYNNELYVSNTKSDLLLKINLDSCKISKIHLNENIKGSWGVFRYKNALWLTPMGKGYILKSDIESGVVTKYKNFPNNISWGKSGFAKGYIKENYLMLLPYTANCILKINLEIGTIQSIKNYRFNEENAFWYMFETLDYIYLKDLKGNGEYLKICKTDNSITNIAFKLNEGNMRWKSDYIKFKISHGEVLKENSMCHLKELIDFVKG